MRELVLLGAERLEKAAARFGARVPQELDTSREAWLKDLQKKDGAGFENAFLTDKVESYSQAVTEYRNCARRHGKRGSRA